MNNRSRRIEKALDRWINAVAGVGVTTLVYGVLDHKPEWQHGAWILGFGVVLVAVSAWFSVLADEADERGVESGSDT